MDDAIGAPPVVGVDAMIVQLTRIVFLTAGALGGFAVSQLIDWTAQIGFRHETVIIIFIILGAAIGYLLGGIMGREAAAAYKRIARRFQQDDITELVLAAAGLVFGLLVALLVSMPLRMVEPKWLAFLATVLLYGICAYGGVNLSLLKRAEVRTRFSPFAAEPAVRREPVFLDTSAVIDGRFETIRSAGFLPGEARVPRFVLAELQTLADSADDIKRARGRRGLDTLARINASGAGVPVFETDYPDTPAVDAKLVRLSKDTAGALLTVDYNLTKAARAEGAVALNLNELAEAVRPAFLPGDAMHLMLVKEGKESGQGVGYLEDGTMVVVQDAISAVGTEVDAEVTSVLQTSAGRMIFARPA